MGLFCHDDILDLLLDGLANSGDRLCVCSTEPTTYTEATSTYKLAIHTLTAGDGNGDWTIANGDASGRKLTLAEQAAISVDATGTAAHIAIADSGNSKLLFVLNCTSQSLTQGNTVTVPTFDIEVADPT